MKCDLCREKEAVHNYVLEDGSSIEICEECGKIVYDKEFKQIIAENRLFQIILMMESVSAYKKCKPKVLVKK